MGPLVSGNEVAGGALARKLGIKLLQRLALTFLEPRLAPWRYCRDKGGDLEVTLGGVGGSATAAATGTATVSGGDQKMEEDAEEGDEEYEIAEEIEEVVEQLLTVGCIGLDGFHGKGGW